MQELSYRIYPEGDTFVAECIDLEVASDGLSKDEAVQNLHEAVALYLDGEGFTLAEVTGDVPLSSVGNLIADIGRKTPDEK